MGVIRVALPDMIQILLHRHVSNGWIGRVEAQSLGEVDC